jgi:hypothetical protein
VGCLVDPPAVLTAASDYPELCVEWLPTVGPFAPDGDWCDITAYVADGSTKRGRQYEVDQFQSGTCSLTLRASTRLFDPDNTASPFRPYLIPMRQIRVSAVWNSVRYPVFRGYITDWGQTVPDDAFFETTISARDAFAVLEQIKLPSSAWALEIVKDDPSLWFRLGETDTVRVTDSSDGGNYGLYDNCEQGVTGLVVNDADGGAAFAHSLEERIVIQNPSLITAYPFTISAMIRIGPEHPTGSKVIFAGYPGTPGDIDDSQVSIYLTEPGVLAMYLKNGADYRYTATVAPVADGQPHHIACVFESASSHLIYVDGEEAIVGGATGGTGSPAWFTTTPPNYTIGNVTDIGIGDFGFGNNLDDTPDAVGPHLDFARGVIDEVCVWNGLAVSAERIAAHSAAALDGWDGDLSGARVARLLDRKDWPPFLRNLAAGVSMLGPASWGAGEAAMSVLQRWADTELGAFFAGKDGKLVWRSRHYALLNSASTTSQATFGDAHSAATLKYDNNGVALVRDETLLRNPVQASRDGGVTVVVSDDAYVEKYGDRTWSAPTTEDQKDSAVRDRAIYLLARYKELGTRLADLVFTPRRDPSNLWPQALGRELGDRITVKRTPLGLNNEISTEQIIERVEHTFGPKTWTTRFVGSPVDPNVGTYLILDDATYGLLDTGRLAY